MGPNSIPWQVYLTFGCGGALISDRHVLTAGHCTRNRTISELDIIVGQRLRFPSDGKRHEICKKSVHPNYTEFQHPTIDVVESVNFDFSILHLKTPVNLGPYVQPVCLPENQSNYSGGYLINKMMTVSGWGDTEHGERSNELQSVAIPGISNEVCGNILDPNEPNKIEDCHLCAGNLEASNFSGACRGDSGG